MEIGEIVRYRQEFLSGYSGINCWVADLADCCGEVIQQRPHDIVRVRWDDDTESLSRVSTLEVVKPLPNFPESHHQEDLLAWRTLVLADFQNQFTQQWADNRDEILKKLPTR